MTLTVETFKNYLNDFDLCSCINFLDTVERLRDQASSCGDISKADQWDALLSEVQALPLPTIEFASENPVASICDIVNKTLCFINGVQKAVLTLDLPVDGKSKGADTIDTCRNALGELGVNISLQGEKWVIA